MLLPALLSTLYGEGHSHCSSESTVVWLAEGMTLTGTGKKSPLILYIGLEHGKNKKKNESDLQQSCNSVFKQEIKWFKRIKLGEKKVMMMRFFSTTSFLVLSRSYRKEHFAWEWITSQCSACAHTCTYKAFVKLDSKLA